MCGISGIINTKNQSIDSHVIKKMNGLVTHRGPDDEGYFFGSNFALGHRRLAIIDLSSDGHQPMSYIDKYTITYNGEIYNYLELKTELKKEGYRFSSKTDTEVILAAYDKWGTECVHYFNGMWAFAIYDSEKNILFCSRDRFGIKPFYYSIIGNLFCFGSEIKQFTVVEGWQPVANYTRAYEFLKFAIFDHTEETLFSNVFQLRGGHNLFYSLDDHSYDIHQWYNLEDKIQTLRIEPEEAADRFQELFTDSVRLRLRSDVKVGSCLSGGLDSSSIVCVMNRLLNQQNAAAIQETVSSCFDIKKYDEQNFIDEVVRHTGVNSNKVFPLFGSLFDEIDQIVWHQDEPFLSTSIFAQWKVFQHAQKNRLAVMLDGQGADELLAGYHGFYGAFYSYLLKRGKLITLIKEISKFKTIHNYSFSELCTKAIQNFFPTKQNSLELKQFIKEKGYPNKFYQSGFSAIKEKSLNQITCTTLPMLLHYEDRNSMAHSVEARVPFLDYRLVEYLLNLPEHYKIHNGITKWILRQALEQVVPQKILTRHDKMGFVTPESVWLNENKNLFRQEFCLASDILNMFVHVDKAREYFDKLTLKSSEIGLIWRIICLGRWANVFGVKFR